MADKQENGVENSNKSQTKEVGLTMFKLLNVKWIMHTHNTHPVT